MEDYLSKELTHVELQGIKSDAIEGIKNYLKLFYWQNKGLLRGS